MPGVCQQIAAQFVGARRGVFTAHFKQPKPLEFIFTGVCLKQSLRLVFRDHPVHNNLIAERIVKAERGVAIESNDRLIGNGGGHRNRRQTRESLCAAVRRIRFRAENERSFVLFQSRHRVERKNGCCSMMPMSFTSWQESEDDVISLSHQQV